MKPSLPILRRGAVALLALCLSPSAFAEAPAYKADKSFGTEDLKSPPVCLSMGAADQLFVLQDDGTVVIYGADGKKTGGFKSDLNPAPTTMTVADGRVHLFSARREAKEMTYRGKKVKRMVSAGVVCRIHDAAGAKVGELSLPEAASAADAHFIGKELAIGDFEKQQIVFYEVNGNEAKMTRKIDKVFRLCCGIFDFCPGREADTLIAANLGAFKVQSFKGGAKTTDFGARGEKPEEFHGCCNPVNVDTLPDGAVITVEKGPTRVKIFTKDGKSCTKVTGLTELVEGCSTIPIAVDSKGVIYLASSEKKCVVKCVPGVSDKPEPPEPKEDAPGAEVEMDPAMKLFSEQVFPLLEQGKHAEAKAAAEKLVKDNPAFSDDQKLGIMLSAVVMPFIEKGDADGAIKEVDTLLKQYPNAKEIGSPDELKESIRSAVESMKKMKEEMGEEEMDDEDAKQAPADAPKEPAAKDGGAAPGQPAPTPPAGK